MSCSSEEEKKFKISAGLNSHSLDYQSFTVPHLYTSTSVLSAMTKEGGGLIEGSSVNNSAITVVLFAHLPKCENFDHSDFHDFYTILKSFWAGDFVVII